MPSALVTASPVFSSASLKLLRGSWMDFVVILRQRPTHRGPTVAPGRSTALERNQSILARSRHHCAGPAGRVVPRPSRRRRLAARIRPTADRCRPSGRCSCSVWRSIHSARASVISRKRSPGRHLPRACWMAWSAYRRAGRASRAGRADCRSPPSASRGRIAAACPRADEKGNYRRRPARASGRIRFSSATGGRPCRESVAKAPCSRFSSAYHGSGRPSTSADPALPLRSQPIQVVPRSPPRRRRSLRPAVSPTSPRRNFPKRRRPRRSGPSPDRRRKRPRTLPARCRACACGRRASAEEGRCSAIA